MIHVLRRAAIHARLLLPSDRLINFFQVLDVGSLFRSLLAACIAHAMLTVPKLEFVLKYCSSVKLTKLL